MKCEECGTTMKRGYVTTQGKLLRQSVLSQIPIDLTRVSPENIDREILRAAIIAEWDAVNLYEQMAEIADNPDIREVLLDVAGEEKTHVGEFCALLEIVDPEGAEDIMRGIEEVQDAIGEEEEERPIEEED
jgi:rubrerythrin